VLFTVLLQLKKEGRRNEYERHKLEALNQRQKMVKLYIQLFLWSYWNTLMQPNFGADILSLCVWYCWKTFR